MPDIFILYPVAWLLFMGLGAVGYFVTRGASGYLLFQALAAILVLFLFRDSFTGMDQNIWMIYFIGFLSYGLAFIVGASARRMEGAVAFQIMAFFITYMILPWFFGVKI